jgi:hypothetical protein
MASTMSSASVLTFLQADHCPITVYSKLNSTPLHFPNKLHSSHSQSFVTTDGQSASLSWCEAPIWGLRPDFYYCQTVQVCWCGALSLTRERVCCLQFLLASPAQSFLGPSPAGLVTISYCLRFETPPTWRARSPYLYPPGTGWPSYTPRHWVTFSSPSTTRGTTVSRET